MMLPTIHLNGTSAASLLDDVVKACNAMRDAVAALQEAAPNARDYYPQGPNAFEAARKEHETRMHRLADNIRELQEIGESIQA